MSENQNPLCATCRKWWRVPDNVQPDSSGKVTYGHCRARPPRVHFLPMPPTAKDSLLKLNKPGFQAPLNIQPVNVFPATEAREWCAEHSAWVTVDALVYDPDRYAVNSGFNRPPTLTEALKIAANQDEVLAAAKRNAQAQATDDNVPDLGPAAPGT